MTFLNRVARALETSFVNAGRTRARRDLLERGERFLADNGFSRELLERGNAAWPWRVESDVSPVLSRVATPPAVAHSPAMPARDAELARAVAELSALSDAELSDLDIARPDIAAAVRDGRPGIDRPAGGAGDRMAA